MKMANFLMRKNTPVAEVTDGTHLSADVTRVGAVDVQRGAIGDIAATDDGMVVVTNHSDDTVSLLRADTLAVAGVVAVPASRSRSSSLMAAPTSAPRHRFVTPSR